MKRNDEPEDEELTAIRENLTNAEKKLDRLYERRNELNDQAAAAREARNAMNDQKRHLLDEAHALKDKRDELTAKAQEHRARRNALQAQAKELIEVKRQMRQGTQGGGIGRVRDLEGRIKSLQFEQETSAHLTIEKENALLKQLETLRKELKEAEAEAKREKELLDGITDIDARIDELFHLADEEHALAVGISDEAQKYHEKMDPLFKEVRYLNQKSDEKHAAFVELKEQADRVHAKIVEMRDAVVGLRGERRGVYEERDRIVREQNESVRAALDDDAALDEAADEAIELLLKKKRVQL